MKSGIMSPAHRQQGWRLAVKRAIDIGLGGAGLAVLSPVIGAVALAVRLRMGRPVLFRQVRPGRDARPYELLKFRTMTDARDTVGTLLPDEQRLTRLGQFLRGFALDELPQLLNVLRGEMSLVGPRPLLVEYLDRYSPEQACRHEVLPGISGWAQVNGRNSLSWNQRLSHDKWYVDHWSPSLDLRILARTPAYVLSRMGVSAPGHATMPPFEGDARDTGSVEAS